MEDTEIELVVLTKEQTEQFHQIVDIEKTSKVMTSSFYVILLMCNIILLIFSDRENAGSIVLMVILFMMMWTIFNLTRLNKKRCKLLDSLHKSGLAYLQINNILKQLKKDERNE